MSPTETPPGWHPDPANPASSLRWWDGTRWTSDVRPMTGPPPGPYAGPSGPYNDQFRRDGAPPGWYGPSGPNNDQVGGNGTPPGWYGPVGPPQWSGGQVSFARRNQRSLTAISVATVYIVLAIASHLVFFGIFPLLLSVRAWQARETLAPVAVAVTVVVILVSVVSLIGR